MSTQAVTPFEAAGKPETLQDLLKKDSYRNRFEQVLGARAPQFISSILSLGTRLKGVEPRSILASAAIAASLDLPIDPNLGFAWIVPYKKNGVMFGQFQLGTKGIIQLAQRTGSYRSMNAEAVNAEVYKGRDEIGEPKIDWEEIDEDKPVEGYVFSFRMINGFTKVCYWSKKKVEAHAKRYSQSYRGGYDSPWKDNFDKMALKTVVANELRRWGMLSVEMQGAFASDHGIKRDIDAPAEFPEPSDEINRPVIDGQAPEQISDAKAETDAGLAPATPAPKAKLKPAPKAPTRTEFTDASPEPEPPAQAPSPEPAPTTPAPQPAEMFGDPEPQPEQTQQTPYDIAAALMERDGVREEELMPLLKRRKITAETTEELRQVSDLVLIDMCRPENWAKVSAQCRLDRKAKTKG